MYFKAISGGDLIKRVEEEHGNLEHDDPSMTQRRLLMETIFSTSGKICWSFVDPATSKEVLMVAGLVDRNTGERSLFILQKGDPGETKRRVAWIGLDKMGRVVEYTISREVRALDGVKWTALLKEDEVIIPGGQFSEQKKARELITGFMRLAKERGNSRVIDSDDKNCPVFGRG